MHIVFLAGKPEGKRPHKVDGKILEWSGLK